jgi:UPF0755 protein
MERQSRSIPLAIGVTFTLMLAIAMPFARLAHFAWTPLDLGPPKEIHFDLEKGHLSREIAKSLAEQSIISSDTLFYWLGRVTRNWQNVKAGEYLLSSGFTPLHIFSILTSGQSIKHAITIREGENLYEIAENLEKEGLSKANRFIELCKNTDFIQSLQIFDGSLPPSLEGYLFPDTYYFNKTMSDADMMKQMIKQFLVTWGQEHDQKAIRIGMNRHQVLTLASMIEKETGAPEERSLISSVFHNRLRKKMRLQSDPTTIYGMWNRYVGRLSRADLTEKNQYNTYSIPGLPIGPIGNPGKEAIDAALNPSQSTYLFFVSHNDGTHEFTKNFQDHQRAVHKFQLDPKARIGKSWRDLAKNQKVQNKKTVRKDGPRIK